LPICRGLISRVLWFPLADDGGMRVRLQNPLNCGGSRGARVAYQSLSHAEKFRPGYHERHRGRDHPFFGVGILIPLTASELVAWRDRLGLQQDEAARLLRVSPRALRYYESGERPISFLLTVVCHAFEHWPYLRQQISELIAK
jgi:hypothetical protein